MATELDREAVEALLPWNLRAALPDICRAWGVRDPEDWPRHPLLADWLALTAAQVLAARHARRGESPTAALRAACAELGMGYAATRSRLIRNRVADGGGKLPPKPKKRALTLPSKTPEPV